jgi:steroid 5-alpha reductase family enzyme
VSALLPVLGAALFFMIIVMGAGWCWQKRTNNSGWIDVFWTFGTGIAGAVCALLPVPGGGGFLPRQLIVAALVSVWALRLGVYIAVRVSKSSAEDARYKRLKQEWGTHYQGRMFWFMEIQSLATTLLCLAIVLAARNPAPDLMWTDGVGVLILALCIFGEGLADRQMKAFKADPTNHGKVCDAGLWGLSRHPNYLFEGMGWTAYAVIALGGQWSHPLPWLAWLGAVFMFALLRFATGVPPLEAAMLASKGEAFADYQRRVPALFPNPFQSAQPRKS